MITQTEITQRNHRRAVRSFLRLLIGATLVSLVGNITHAVLPCIPRVIIQIGAAAVPPMDLLHAARKDLQRKLIGASEARGSVPRLSAHPVTPGWPCSWLYGDSGARDSISW
jgi:hypothetical protein